MASTTGTTFTTLDTTALDAYLRSLHFTREQVPHTRETAYIRRSKTDRGVGIVIYTSTDGTRTRARGEDAIRVCLVDLVNRRGLKRSTRINRVGGQSAIEARIKDRIQEFAKWHGANIGVRLADGRLTWKGSGKPLDYTTTKNPMSKVAA